MNKSCYINSKKVYKYVKKEKEKEKEKKELTASSIVHDI